jgi:hypothetical protein
MIVPKHSKVTINYRYGSEN